MSSVIDGMTDDRAAAHGAIEAVGANPVLFEDFGGRDDDPEAAYLHEVATSDIYVGILGPRYGIPARSGYSATQAEYDEAERRGLRVSVWTTTGDMGGRQQDFRDTVRVFHTTGSYDRPEELGRKIEARLRLMAAGALTPWVKIGDTVVRARTRRDDGSHISVAADVRNPSILARLEGSRPGLGRASDLQLTWRGGSASVRVDSVTTETGASSRLQRVTIDAHRSESRVGSLTGVATEGYSAEELIDLRMRTGLFGEPNPLRGLAHMAEGTNPLRQLDGISLGEDSYAEIAELLLTEELSKEEGVGHLINFRLGPPSGGRRRLRLGWMPTKRYINVEPLARAIEGTVTLS